MIFPNLYKNKRVGLIGLGKTGKSVAESMNAVGAKIKVYDDSGIIDPKYSELSIDEIESGEIDVLVISPGVHILWPDIHPMVNAARKKSIPILNDMDLFQQHISKKTICITGTNGKSTTAALVHHIFNCAGKRVEIGGNFGNPVLLLDANADFFVLELSSYQLESCNILGFDTSILLNIAPDHLARHGGMAGYIAVKQKIFANAKSNMIIGIDDDYCEEILVFFKGKIVPISGKRVPENGLGWENNKLVDNRFNSYEIICDSSSFLDGDHNRQNIAASYVACIQNGLSKESFQNGLASFRGLEHRQEIVASINGVSYINDSKATNAESVEQALKRFNNIVWIAGGRPKEKGIEILVQYFSKLKFVFLIGEAAKSWSSFLTKCGVENKISETLDIAVGHAYEFSKTGKVDVVLLSPACASFDQFKNFEDRGVKFKSLVTQLTSMTTS
ncbi:MAG: UDP-N-acetylmuramoyl-L-alanine--D-glutamate ligase [Holosporaceae bacterium]|jgi:UDP-N-acetylmuramoylalanine--D-glutamate ligase|nr:UDP-N-acetylmuramoyl-L-alanine--D-glutamate ligase [Holosporaceae bacterium]